MACNSCTKHTPCKRHRKKSKASSVYTPNIALPPPYGVTFETSRPDLVNICKEKTVSFANSYVSATNIIGAIAGVRHRIIVSDNNNTVKLDATFTVGIAFSVSNITIGSADMIIQWFENDAILTIEPGRILPQSSGFMQHFVEYEGNWSVNFDNTELKRWQVDFIYEAPIVVAGQPRSVWVDDGCTLAFAAQNNTDERPIDTVTQTNGISGSLGVGVPQFSVDLTAISGIPTNQNYTSNIINSITTIKLGVGAFAPRYTIKNTGHIAGYVKVEWDNGNEVDFVPANTQRSYPIELGQSITTTAFIINPATGLLDPSTVNISFNNYVFPPRIDTMTFNGILQAGVLVGAFPDENTVKKARSFTFAMPNNDYFAEVKFKEISIIDVDFENPICVNNVANNSPLVTIKDRKNLVSFTQATPSARALYFNNKAIWQGTATRYMQLDLTFKKEHLFLAGSVDVFEPSSLTGGLGIANNQFKTEGFGTVNSSTYIRRGGEDSRFGVYSFTGGSGKPIPDFSYDNSYLGSPFLFNMSNGKTPKLFVKGSSYNYPTIIFLGFTDSPGSYPFHLGSLPQTTGKESVFRSIITEALTSNEIDVLNLKLKTKYGA